MELCGVKYGVNEFVEVVGVYKMQQLLPAGKTKKSSPKDGICHTRIHKVPSSLVGGSTLSRCLLWFVLATDASAFCRLPSFLLVRPAAVAAQARHLLEQQHDHNLCRV